MRVRYWLFGFLLVFQLSSCASVPRASRESMSQEGAVSWLNRYCSKGYRNVSGELVMKSNTREFKGQFPASVSIQKDGRLFLEATNIVGGTVLRIDGTTAAFNLEVPIKPRFSRKGLTEYLGLEIPVLAELLMGDLPCPSQWSGKDVSVTDGRIEIRSSGHAWQFERSAESIEAVPVRVVLTTEGISSRIELEIESWDANYARKVRVHSPEGDLKWVWKSRSE